MEQQNDSMKIPVFNEDIVIEKKENIPIKSKTSLIKEVGMKHLKEKILNTNEKSDTRQSENTNIGKEKVSSKTRKNAKHKSNIQKQIQKHL